MRKERLLSRARELMTEAGFRIGMSDGGLVTEAKPMIKWDKVSHCQALFNESYRIIIKMNNIAGRCCNLHPEECLRSELESGHPDHLRWRRSDWRGRHEGAQGARLQLQGGQLGPGADYGRPQVPGIDNIFFCKIFFLYFPPRVHNLFDCPQVAGFYIKCTAFQTARHQRCANHAALVGALHVKSKKQMKPTTFKKLHLFWKKCICFV